MSLPIILSPSAEAEFDAAADWYEEEAGLGTKFVASVQAAPWVSVTTPPASETSSAPASSPERTWLYCQNASIRPAATWIITRVAGTDAPTRSALPSMAVIDSPMRRNVCLSSPGFAWPVPTSAASSFGFVETRSRTPSW